MKITSVGTGFFIDRDGRLLTNDHVVEGCGALAVEPASGEPLAAKVLAVNARRDLAVIATGLASPGSASFQVYGVPAAGSVVVTVGYPDQGIPPREPLATSGSVRAWPPDLGPMNGLVIKADIRPGNSGGPMLDEHGMVVGVMRAKINTVKVYAESGQFLDEIGLGVPTATVLEFLSHSEIAYQTVPNQRLLGLSDIMDAARIYVARVDCWK